MRNDTNSNGAVRYASRPNGSRQPGEAAAAAARTLAKGHQSRRWLTAVLGLSVAGNIAIPLWFTYQSRLEHQVVLFDVSSGTVLLSPLVDPASSQELVEITASWAARCLLDRSAVGFDDPRLLEILFLRDATKKANQEFAAVKQEFVEKNLRAKVEIKEIKAQAIGQGMILCRVEGQVILTGVVHGEAIQEVQETTLDLKLARNPDLGRNMRYPLAVFDYNYVHQQ